jgi:hypothetical protein
MDTIPDEWREALDGGDLSPAVEALKAAASDERPRPHHIWKAVLKELCTRVQENERRKKKRGKSTGGGSVSGIATDVSDSDGRFEQPAGPRQTRKRRRLALDEEDDGSVVL